MKSDRDLKNQLTASLPKGLDVSMLTPEMRAIVLHLASQIPTKPTISNLWDPDEIVSYWLLLIGGTNRPEHMQVVQELLTWSAFSSRGAAKVVCVQASDAKDFHLCAKHFAASEYPSLYLGTSPEMSTFVGLPRSLLLELSKKEGVLQDFFTETHTALVKGESLSDINKKLLKDQTKRYAAVIYKEFRGIVSFSASASASV